MYKRQVLEHPEIQQALPGTNDATLTWKDLQWLKDKIRGRVPLIAKGVIHPDDAVLAVKHGADAVVVSNHGGRQLDGTVSAVEALPRVVKALEGFNTPVLVDTGVRTSMDVVRCLALGASAVLVGRPPLWALSVNGSDGVRDMFTQWAHDVRDDMKCLGVERVGELGPSVFSSSQ